MSRVDDALEDASAKSDLDRLGELAAKAYADGHDFRVEHGQLLLGSMEHDQEVVIDSGKTCHRFAVVSDTHAGSHFAQESALRHFVRYAADRGKHPDTGERIKPVDFILHPGDLTQGSDPMHRDQPYQVHVHGADQQIEYAARTLPQVGIPWRVIGGNHDDSFHDINVARRICSSRDDLVYLGRTATYLTVGNMKLYVMHPSGGKAYADSYRPQRIAENLPHTPPVNILVCGHWHGYDVGKTHGIVRVSAPSFQADYPWLTAKGIHSLVGGIIMEVWMTDSGEVGRVRHEVVCYQPREDDWDHKISREVVEQWSSRGVVVP